jgi:hypothetical protein
MSKTTASLKARALERLRLNDLNTVYYSRKADEFFRTYNDAAQYRDEKGGLLELNRLELEEDAATVKEADAIINAWRASLPADEQPTTKGTAAAVPEAALVVALQAQAAELAALKAQLAAATAATATPDKTKEGK